MDWTSSPGRTSSGPRRDGQLSSTLGNSPRRGRVELRWRVRVSAEDGERYREARPFDAASRRRAFCTDGSAAFAFASGRARTSTLAGLAAIVIASPVAGLRPARFLVAGLTRTVSWTSPPR